MKYLLVLLVVGFGVWLFMARLRGPRGDGATSQHKAKAPADAAPATMVRCAHCGVHLPAADALPDPAEASRLYCSDAHRRLGPAPSPPA